MEKTIPLKLEMDEITISCKIPYKEGIIDREFFDETIFSEIEELDITKILDKLGFMLFDVVLTTEDKENYNFLVTYTQK